MCRGGRATNRIVAAGDADGRKVVETTAGQECSPIETKVRDMRCGHKDDFARNINFFDFRIHV